MAKKFDVLGGLPYTGIEITAPSALTAGDMSQEENVYGFPFVDIDSGDQGTFITKCDKVYTTIKASGEGWNAGDILYYDSGTPKVTITQGAAYPVIGHAQQNALSAATAGYIVFDGRLDLLFQALLGEASILDLSDTPADYGTNGFQLTTNGTSTTTWASAT